MTTRVLTQAREQVLNQKDLPILIAGDRDYPAGIMGLVAGRLAEEFYRPVIVLRTGERMSGGSCRSIPEFDITGALSQCSYLLSHFGGHARAAGVSLQTRNLPRLREELLEIAAEQLADVHLRPKIDIDAEVTLTELGSDTFPTIQKMAPFGQGNPAPTFLSRKVELVDCHTMGNGNNHLKMKLKQDDTIWDGVGFGLGSYRDEISSPLDIVYSLEVDSWGGEERLRLNVLDFESSS